jgi:hypothetical protein
MRKLTILGSSGDDCIEFDEADAKAVSEVGELFAKLMAGGNVAFKIGPDGKGERTGTFDPAANETIVAPRVVGG